MTGIEHLCSIGGGNMASAIIAGLQPGALVDKVTICDIAQAVRDRHAADGWAVSSDFAPAATADVVLLAVKPQVAEPVCHELAGHLTHGPLVISIMAGVTIARLRDWLPATCRLVRSMPNTPMAIGLGMVGLAPADGVDEDDCRRAEALFAPAAQVLRLPEARIDALTAVSGSGPAYLFRFAEAQLRAAEALGFSPAEARLLVGQTIYGAASYLQQSEGFPAARLRQQVTSPGGTTAAGLAVFDEADLDDIVRRVTAAAAERSRELAS